MPSQTLPKLYQYNVCPFCWKVRTVLAYKKVPYETIEVHPLNKKEIAFSKNYKKVPLYINAQGKQVNDSTPIMRAIDAEYPENPVFETDAEKKKREDVWLDWCDKKLVRALPPLIYKDISSALAAFDYITQIEKFSWLQKRFIKYSGAVVMTLVAKKSAKEQKIENPAAHFEKCLKDWSEVFKNDLFFGGQKPNGADFAAFGILKSVESLPAAFQIIQKNKKVKDWYQAMEGRVPV